MGGGEGGDGRRGGKGWEEGREGMGGEEEGETSTYIIIHSVGTVLHNTQHITMTCMPTPSVRV